MQVKDLVWQTKELMNGEDTLYIAYSDVGRFTVLDRLTGYGYGDVRDIETGYGDTEGKFWLASGGVDIRQYPDLDLIEAIEFIKEIANTCKGE